MRRRPSLASKVHHERWLVSYADFITLLFAFFVVMYSVSQVSEEKYRQLSETLQGAFADGTPRQSSDAASPTQNDQSTDSQSESVNLASLETLSETLREALGAMAVNGELRVGGNEEWVEIALDANLLFASGEAALQPQALDMLRALAGQLAPFDNAIAVAGHTDNVPIRSTTFASNWHLSAARAVAVVDVLSGAGVAPVRLSAVGYGEHQPVADNTTAEGRAQNRRVVLRVMQQAAEVPRRPAASLGDAEAEASASGSSPNPSAEASVESAPAASPAVEPVRLRGGGLLFTSDPDLPRTNPPVEAVPAATDAGESAPAAEASGPSPSP